MGEILLRHNWVDWESLALAIDDHKRARMRLTSYLVWKGAVDFDDASRALGEQFGVAAALRKHLEHRDRTLMTEVPVYFARRRIVLPIGRLGNGALIIVARDPSPALQAELSRVVRGPFVVAVAPSKYLERMVVSTYPRGTSGELDVPIEIDDSEELGDADLLADEPEDHDFDIDVEMPPPKPVSTSKPLPVEIKPVAVPRRAPTEPVRDPLETAIAALADIDEVEWLLDTVMGYAANRWQSSLLLKVEERRAVGVRGHGTMKPTAIPAFVIPLSDPSSVSAARDEKRVIDEPPEATGKAQSALVELLAVQGTPVAAPFVKGDTVPFILVVGDPVAGKDPEDSAIDLGLLGEAMQDALGKL